MSAMAGGSGAAGSVPNVLHQPPGISGISHLFAVKKIRNRDIPGLARDISGDD